jgi:hypothetical protein
MSDSAFFHVIGPNLLIYEQKIHKKIVVCFDVIPLYLSNLKVSKKCHFQMFLFNS